MPLARLFRPAPQPAIKRPPGRLAVERLEARDNPSGGLLDPTFGVGGVAAVPRIDTGVVNAVATQPDGKVLTVGTVVNSKPSGISVTRLNADGTLDATFGTGGTAVVGPAKATYNFAYGYTLAIQPDGKILVAGLAYTKKGFWGDSDAEFAVGRLNSNGTLDKTFGGANTGWWESNPTAGDEIVWKLAVVPNVGGFSIYAGGQSGTAAVVVKLTAAGRPDPTYGVGGVARQATTDWSFNNNYHCQLAVTPTGRAVVYTDSGKLLGFTPAGQADTGFGTGGAVSVSFNVGGLVAQGESVLAVGTQNPTPSHGVVTRYTPAGTVDTTFGTNGVFVGPSAVGTQASRFTGLVVAGDGSLVIVGSASRKDDAGVVHRGILLGRLSADGQPDATFGPAPDGSGLVIRYDQDLGIQNLLGLNGDTSAVAIDSAGNIVVGGSQYVSSTVSRRVVLRFTTR